jgi:hypothetical protein
MAKSKRPGKAAAHRAGKILQNPRSTKAAKSAAAKTLARRAVSKRTVKPAPKSGILKKMAIRKAVATAKAKKKS